MQFSVTWQLPINLVGHSGIHFVPECLPDLAVAGGSCTCAFAIQIQVLFHWPWTRLSFLSCKKRKQEWFTEICKTESKFYHSSLCYQSQIFFSLSRTFKSIIIMECSKKIVNVKAAGITSWRHDQNYLFWNKSIFSGSHGQWSIRNTLFTYNFCRFGDLMWDMF